MSFQFRFTIDLLYGYVVDRTEILKFSQFDFLPVPFLGLVFSFSEKQMAASLM